MDIESSAGVPSAGKFTLISEEKARQLYEQTLRLRVAPGSGLEAVLAAVTADLRSDDAVILSDASTVNGALGSSSPCEVRSPQKTAPRDRMPGRMPDRIVDALSRPLADRLLMNGRVTVIFLPRTPSAIVEEARAVASAARLPVLFVEDARMHPPMKAKTRAANGKSDSVDAMPVIPVDAEDVIALYRVAHESIARARNGGGPTQIVCVRWKPPGNGHRHRASEGAIPRLEQWLTSRGLPAQAWREEILQAEEAANRKSGPAEARQGDSQRFAQADIQTN